MTKPDLASVPTLSGRELEVAVEKAFGVADCLTNSAAFFALIEAVRANGWTVEITAGSTLGGISTGGDWSVSLSCNRGPCELHGNPHHNCHSVEAEGSTMPLAFARAALKTTYTEAQS